MYPNLPALVPIILQRISDPHPRVRYSLIYSLFFILFSTLYSLSHFSLLCLLYSSSSLVPFCFVSYEYLHSFSFSGIFFLVLPTSCFHLERGFTVGILPSTVSTLSSLNLLDQTERKKKKMKTKMKMKTRNLRSKNFSMIFLRSFASPYSPIYRTRVLSIADFVPCFPSSILKFARKRFVHLLGKTF